MYDAQMKWRECVQHYYDAGYDRYSWPPHLLGFDCNPDALTYNDFWGAVRWVVTLPTDFLLNLPKIHAFFEMEGPAIGTNFSMLIGFLLIFIAAVAIMSSDDPYTAAQYEADVEQIDEESLEPHVVVDENLLSQMEAKIQNISAEKSKERMSWKAHLKVILPVVIFAAVLLIAVWAAGL